MDDIPYKKAGDLLDTLFRGETASKIREYSSFSSGWEIIVGPRFSAHSYVQEIKNGVLVIRVDHPGWVQLLQMEQTKILSKIMNQYPSLGVRAMVFRQVMKTENESSQTPQTPQELSEPEKSIPAEMKEDLKPEIASLLRGLQKAMNDDEEEKDTTGR